MMDPSFKDSWEVSKENIQPLSSGRHVAALNESLQTASSLDHDAYVNDLFTRLKDEVSEYNGPDPLEPWHRFLTEFEKACPTEGKYTTQLENTLANCVRKFVVMPQYHNDQRYIKILIKSMKNFEPCKRTPLFKNLMDSGVGNKTSALYLAYADDLEFLNQNPKAVEVLKNGLNEGAEPKQYLEDALRALQYRVSERLAKDMQVRAKDNSEVRSFGNDVPVYGPDNTAPSIRTDLTRTSFQAQGSSQSQKLKKPTLALNLYQSENDLDEPSTSASEPKKDSRPLHMPSIVKRDKENELAPGKWNRVSAEIREEEGLGTAVVQQAIPKVTLFVEEGAMATNVPAAVQAPKNVLKEHKTSQPDDHVFQKPDVVSQFQGKIMYCKKKLSRNGKEISPEEYMADKFFAKLKAKRERIELLKYAEGYTSSPKEKCTVCEEKDGIISKLNEEHACSLREKNETIDALKCQLTTAETKITTFRNERESLIHRLEENKQEIASMTRKLQVCNQKYQADVERFNSLLLDKERNNLELKELLDSKEKQLLKVSPNSFSASPKGLLKEKKKVESVPIITEPTVPKTPFAAAQKLPFTLYESCMEEPSTVGVGMVKEKEPTVNTSPKNLCSNAPAQKSATNARAPVPKGLNVLSEPTVSEKSVTTVVRTDENAQFPTFRQPRKSFGRGLSVHQITAIEDEEDEVIFHHEAGNEFNVSNLTRALEFCPKPLLNSTPERATHSRMSVKPNHDLQTEIESNEIQHAGSTSSVSHSVDFFNRFNTTDAQNGGQNLSTIQENSKESRSTTGGSSSGNITGMRGNANSLGASSYFNSTRSASAPRSASRPFGYGPGSSMF